MEYRMERENLYQLKIALNHSLVKLQNIFNKIDNAKLPGDRKKYLVVGEETIDSAKEKLK